MQRACEVTPLGVTGAQVARLLDRLDEMGQGEQRHSDRFPYRREGVRMRLLHATGTTDVRVYTRNLSCGGVGLLQRGYMNIGTRCAIFLPRDAGDPVVVTGTVANCRHVVKLVHEVGIRFYEKIDVADFIDLSDVLGAAIVSDENQEEGEVRNIGARVLCISDDAARLEDRARALGEAGTEVATATFLGAGADRIRRRRFDAVVCDSRIESHAAPEILGILRRAGHAGLVVLMGETASTGDDRAVAVNSGEMAQMVRVIEEHLEARGPS